MAYSASQTTAQMITELQTVNPSLQTDAILTFLSELATGWPVAVGTGLTFNGVLIKCITGYGLPPGTTPAYEYDATPA